MTTMDTFDRLVHAVESASQISSLEVKVLTRITIFDTYTSGVKMLRAVLILAS